jgi:DNA polymerase III delta prime subunit
MALKKEMIHQFGVRPFFQALQVCVLCNFQGIGKTTMAHLVAQTEGYDPLEFNASDVRSKKALEVIILVINL